MVYRCQHWREGGLSGELSGGLSGGLANVRAGGLA